MPRYGNPVLLVWYYDAECVVSADKEPVIIDLVSMLVVVVNGL